MANEIRLRRNNIAGAITDNPLSNVATTINSPGFVDLPVVDATNHLILILDPLEVNGPAEIVRVTTHAAAASVVTVTRGAEGSSARAHILGTTWFHGPVAGDFELTDVTSGTRPAVPYTGESIFETDTARAMRYSGTAWQQDGLYFDPPACRVFHNTTQSIVNNTETTVAFNSETFDPSGMHDTAVNNSRITVTTPGLYLFTWGLILASDTDYTAISSYVRANGSTVACFSNHIGTMGAAGQNPQLSGSGLFKAVANDFFEVRVTQVNTSANANNVSGGDGFIYFTTCWIGRGN